MLEPVSLVASSLFSAVVDLIKYYLAKILLSAVIDLIKYYLAGQWLRCLTSSPY